MDDRVCILKPGPCELVEGVFWVGAAVLSICRRGRGGTLVCDGRQRDLLQVELGDGRSRSPPVHHDEFLLGDGVRKSFDGSLLTSGILDDEWHAKVLNDLVS